MADKWMRNSLNYLNQKGLLCRKDTPAEDMLAQEEDMMVAVEDMPVWEEDMMAVVEDMLKQEEDIDSVCSIVGADFEHNSAAEAGAHTELAVNICQVLVAGVVVHTEFVADTAAEVWVAQDKLKVVVGVVRVG